MTISPHRSRRLVMDFPAWIVTVSFMMAALPQVAREENSSAQPLSFQMLLFLKVSPCACTVVRPVKSLGEVYIKTLGLPPVTHAFPGFPPQFLTKWQSQHVT